MRAGTNVTAPARLRTYLAEIAVALPGPRRHRDRILAELRDGLDTSVDTNIDRGLSEDDAVAAAIDDFGHPDAVGAAFAAELAIADARRTVLWYLFTGPLVGVWWLLALQTRTWRAGPGAVLAVIPALPLIVVAIVAVIGILATTGRLMRWFPEATARQAVTGSVAVAGLAIIADLVMISMYVRSSQPVHPLGLIGVAASATRCGCSGVVLVRLSARRRSPADRR